MGECDKLKQIIAPYEKLFDMIRVVDPIQKKTIELEDGKTVLKEVPCYSLWDTDEACKNCVAEKASKGEKTFVKIQYDMEKMYLIFAAPITVGDKTIAIELLKDVTENLVFETVDGEYGHEERNIIDDLNSLLLKDALTGLYNRRYINQVLPVEIERSKKDKCCLSVVMADIDCFKSVNDIHGHHAGDIVIKKVAGIMSRYIRNDTDWIARYGGDEILICLNNADSKKAYKIIERLRKAIEGTMIKVDDIKIKVTASFGVCTVKSDLAKEGHIDIIDIIKCADEKLYKAKDQGRNRVIS